MRGSAPKATPSEAPSRVTRGHDVDGLRLPAAQEGAADFPLPRFPSEARINAFLRMPTDTLTPLVHFS